MRAAVITRHGGPEVLEIRDVELPTIDADGVLVRVRASAINRADILQRKGGYAVPPGSPRDIPGLEFAGEVAEVGSKVSEWRAGDRVFGIAGGGAHAEYIAVPGSNVARIPSTLSWTDAGAIPEAYITAHDALITQGRLEPGQPALIHAVGSGVGVAAVQVARALGAIPFGTSRTPEKIDRAMTYGLERGAVIREPSELVPAAKDWAPAGFDVVLDLVGGAYTPASIELIAIRGRLMLVGLVAGSSATMDLRRLLSRRASIIATLLRPRSVAEKAEATAAFSRDLSNLFDTGVLRAVVDQVFPLEALGDAHRRMESNASFGKVVIVVP
jgi:putative PIG3 family NAD(P)H quinone oxidoreductase